MSPGRSHFSLWWIEIAYLYTLAIDDPGEGRVSMGNVDQLVVVL